MNARKRGGYKSVFAKVIAQMDPEAKILDRDTLISDFLSTHDRARFADVRKFIENKFNSKPQDAPAGTPELGKAESPPPYAWDGVNARLRSAERLLIEFRNEVDFFLATCTEVEIRQSWSDWRKLVTKTGEHFKRFGRKGVRNGRRNEA